MSTIVQPEPVIGSMKYSVNQQQQPRRQYSLSQESNSLEVDNKSNVKESSVLNVLVPISVFALSALCVWKLYKKCAVLVRPQCVTVVYDTRRRRILCTSLDYERAKLHEPFISSSHQKWSRLLLHQRNSLILVPPSSLFSVFVLPKSVFSETGEMVACEIDNVVLHDGVVRLSCTIRYNIPFMELERYLSTTGANAPNEKIALATSNVARLCGSEASVGILLSRSRRELVFMESFRAHLASKLISYAAVQLLGVIIENVELIENDETENAKARKQQESE